MCLRGGIGGKGDGTGRSADHSAAFDHAAASAAFQPWAQHAFRAIGAAGARDGRVSGPDVRDAAVRRHGEHRGGAGGVGLQCGQLGGPHGCGQHWCLGCAEALHHVLDAPGPAQWGPCQPGDCHSRVPANVGPRFSTIEDGEKLEFEHIDTLLFVGGVASWGE